MEQFDTSQIRWREPWEATPADEVQMTIDELRRETCAGHVLFGREVQPVGQRGDTDDVLFYLGAQPPSFALVHFTWQREARTDWPHTVLFDTIEEWLQRCMTPDADAYAR